MKQLHQDCIGPKQNQNGNEARKILIGPKYVLSAHGKIYGSQSGEVSLSQAVDNLACVSVCTQYLLSNGYFSHLLIFYLCSKCIFTGEYCGRVKLDRAEEKRPQIHDRRKFKDPGYKINRGSRMQESPKIQE